jgi:hypothetical protein
MGGKEVPEGLAGMTAGQVEGNALQAQAHPASDGRLSGRCRSGKRQKRSVYSPNPPFELRPFGL